MNDIQILRVREVAELIGMSRATVWRLAKESDFPKPIKLGSHSVGWRAGEVRNWIESRPVVGAPKAA